MTVKSFDDLFGDDLDDAGRLDFDADFGDFVGVDRGDGGVDRQRTIQERFELFHAANPWVYRALVEVARDLVHQHGQRTIGIQMCAEVVRWHYFRRTDDPTSTFKLCNDYTSRYARLIEEREPDLSGVFVLRKLRTP